MNLKKTKRWECKQYTDWVKTLPSCVSLMPADDPHHVKGVLPAGTKVHDLFVMPVTRKEHTTVHDKGEICDVWGNRLIQSDEVLMTINKAINEGLIEIKWVGE